MWFAAALAATAATWQVDGSSLVARRGDWPVHSTVTCPPSPGLRALGVAVEVYGRKQGTMSWGHVSLRVVACRDGQLQDHEYETYRLSDWNLISFREEHRGEPFLAGDQLERQKGALALFRNVDPVDRGWFADAQAGNREIYELWLDLPQPELDRIAVAAEQWYADQKAALRAGEPLPERYRALSTNCTTVLARLLRVDDPPVMPFAWLRRLQDEALLRVLHPSHHLVARWGGLPEEVRRPRPLFRRERDLPGGLDVSGDPLGPWSVQATAQPPPVPVPLPLPVPSW